MSQMLKSALWEQSRAAVWTDNYGASEIRWGANYRDNYFQDFFSVPENEGKIAQAPESVGYFL